MISRRNTLCLFVSVIISPIILASATQTDEEKKLIRQELYTHKGPLTFLFSYPRSGNTWLRYCLEWLTQRPTIEPSMSLGPIAWRAQFPIDLQKAPIHRAHMRDHILNDRLNTNLEVDKLIFIVRHPHETIARDNSWCELLKENKYIVPLAYYYFDNFEFFETWPANRRLLIYYEDLILSPRQTLIRILTFLEEPLTRLDLFMQQYEQHRQKSIALYKTSISKGQDILFHSKKIPLDMLQALDTWIKKTHPHIWDTYLKERYGLS